MILFDDVSKFYGEVLGVNRVNLSIPPGITSLGASSAPSSGSANAAPVANSAIPRPSHSDDARCSPGSRHAKRSAIMRSAPGGFTTSSAPSSQCAS